MISKVFDLVYVYLVHRKAWHPSRNSSRGDPLVRGRDYLIECIAFSVLNKYKQDYVNLYAKEMTSENVAEVWRFIRMYLDNFEISDGVEKFVGCGVDAVLLTLEGEKVEN